MPRTLLSVVVLAVASLVAAPAAAQEATPAVLPATPEPAECRVEPRPTAFFVEVFEATMANPRADVPTFAPGGGGTITPTPIGTPEGEGRAADAATIAGVTATAREYVACLNAGDLPRLFALYSEQAARDNLAFLWSAMAAGRGSGRPRSRS